MKNAAMQKFRRDHLEKGLCVSCTEPALDGFVVCAKHKEKRRTNGERQRRRFPERQLLFKARHRARLQGVPCTITVDDVVIPERCPILGIRLTTGDKVHSSASPTLDKIVPELGYVPGNVQVISYKANAMKSNASLSELIALGEWAQNVYANLAVKG